MGRGNTASAISSFISEHPVIGSLIIGGLITWIVYGWVTENKFTSENIKKWFIIILVMGIPILLLVGLTLLLSW